MIEIAKRNIKLYFRDKAAVFFSLLSVFLIIGLYVLFLGDVVVSSMSEIPSARFVVDSWIVSGLVASCSVTATLGAFGVIVDDYTKNVVKDFGSAPVKKSTLTAGYIISSLVIGIIMSSITLVLGELYILVNGGALLPLLTLLKVLGVIVLSTFANSAILFLIISFVRTQSAFATISTLVGTLVGFLMGVYVPIGNLPTYVQSMVKMFPGTYSASLLRIIIMEKPMDIAFNGAPEEVTYGFITQMGIRLEIGEELSTSLMAILILAGTGVLFYLISILRLTLKKK